MTDGEDNLKEGGGEGVLVEMPGGISAGAADVTTDK